MTDHQGFNYEIDLIQLVKILVRKKWFIIIGTLLFTLAVVGITFLMPRVYISSGFFQLSRGVDVDMKELKEIQDKIRDDLQTEKRDSLTLQNNMLLNDALEDSSLLLKNVSLPDYKKYESRFTNPQQFIQFIHRLQKAGAENLDDLETSIRTADDIGQWLEPVHAYSKKELKDLAQTSKDLKNYVLGVLVNGEQHSPEKARAFVNTMGLFVKDNILYGKLSGYIGAQLNRAKTETGKFDVFIVKDEFKLNQLTEKRRIMTGVLKKYPGSKAMTGRELYSLENNGHRYLSPTAQLVGIESHIADLRENLALNGRNQQLAGVRIAFFTKAKEILTKETFGESLLEKIVQLKKTFFTDQKVSPDVLREVKSSLEVDLGNFINLNEEIRFISGPTLPRRAIKPRKALITAVALVVGFFLFIFLAFFTQWWTDNKKQITA